MEAVLNKRDQELALKAEMQAKKKEERKQKHDAWKEEIYEKNTPPKRSTLEEVGNAVTHGVGALLGVAAMTLMIAKADTPAKMVSAIVYGTCLVLLFTMSCLYHSFRWGSKVKRVFRRFDYSSIYLLIGGTFTPIFLIFWGNTLGIVLCILQWVAIVAGITVVAVFGPAAFKWIHMTLYLLLGWSAIMFLPDMVRECLPLFWYTLGGGIIYTLGIIPFMMHLKGSHFIWHFFVLFGAICQWIGIYVYLF